MQESLLVNKIPTGTKLWRIPVTLAKQYELTENQIVELRCGSLTTQARTVIVSDESIGLSDDILSKLKLVEHTKIGVKFESHNQFRLGPVIGILTFSRVIAKQDLNRYIPYSLRMKNIGLLYVFGSKSINPETEVIKGYYYDLIQRKWKEKEFPFPDVVMDRIYPNNQKTHQKLESIIGQNRIFNKKTLINKIRFFRALHKDEFLQSYIPETRLLKELSDFEYMVRKYPGIFLKPKNGMKGKGIIQVRASDDNLICRYMSKEGPETRVINHSSEIFDVIKSASPRQKSYVIQAEIFRMNYKNQPFGFRVMVVKNSRGQWSAPAIFAKIADTAGFLTNTSAGAKIIFVKNLLNGIKHKLPYSKEQFLKLAAYLSCRTAAKLDKSFGPLGKLGIDIVLDKSGKPWLIEANGNPGLMPRAAIGEYPEWVNQMYDYPLSYCLYLSGFNHLENNFS